MNDISSDGKSQGNYTVISEGDGVGRAVSAELFQSIFRKVNEASDAFQIKLKPTYQIELKNIEGLHHRIEQTIKQYSVTSIALNFSIYYTDDSKSVVNSFEEAARISGASGCQVEAVFLDYKFLIMTSNDEHPKSYAINLQLISPIALQKRVRGVSFGRTSAIMRRLNMEVSWVKIEYSDYNVARSLKHVITEWIPTVDKAKFPKHIKFFQAISHNFPRIFVAISILILMIYVIDKKRFFSITSFNELYSCLMLSGFAFFSVGFLARYLGVFAEVAIDAWSPISYLKLNEVDEVEISKLNSMNKRTLIISSFLFITNIFLSVVFKNIFQGVMDYFKGG